MPYWLLVVACAWLSFGCVGLPHASIPGTLQDGSRIHAFQTASFSYAFMASHARQWDATLAKLEADGLPLLRALGDTRMDVALAGKRRSEAMVYDVDLVFAGEAEPVRVHAEAGMDARAYDEGAARGAAAAGVPAALLRDGHFAIYATAAMMTALNASNESLERHAFGLLVLRRKIEAGERADYLAPTRSAEETLADIEVALRVIAAHHARMSKWRAEVLAFIALIEASESEGGIDALTEQVAAARGDTQAWLRDNPAPPTMEQFGVAMNELKLPTPDRLLELLDEDGYLAAAVQVATSIATGDPRATIQGFAKLAPKDTSLRTALEGVAAAANGDVKGTLSALRTLSAGSDIAPLVATVERVYATVENARDGVASIGATLGGPTALAP